MSFASPWALFALLAIPALAAAYVLYERHRRASAARFASLGLLPNLVERVPSMKRHLPVAVLLVALTAMIFGVARPHANVTVGRKEATVILALDVSRSMGANDVRPTRLQAARKAAETFLDRLPASFRFGVVAIGSNAVVALPPTTDRALAHSALRSLRRSEGTVLGDGLALALQLGQRQRTSDGQPIPTAVLMISDGADQGSRTRPQVAAARAKALHIPVYTAVIGTPDGIVERTLTGGFKERIRVPASPTTLRQIAQASGGKFFSAPTAKGVDEVYEQLRTRLGHHTQSREISDFFAAGSGALMLMGAALSGLWFRRLL